MQQVLCKYDPINESPLFSVMAEVETCVSNRSPISVGRKANMRSYPCLLFWVESWNLAQFIRNRDAYPNGSRTRFEVTYQRLVTIRHLMISAEFDPTGRLQAQADLLDLFS
jgi:hypothetical protein